MIKPRASKSGLYASCAYSYWLDNLIQSGLIPKPDDVEDTSSPYADLGTLIHGKLQTKLNCVMQTTLDEALTPLIDNASKLFKSKEDMDAAIASSVLWAASVFPTANDGKAWVAEPAGEIETLTGHLDFESQDQTEIIDLKTTSRKPDNARMKPLHLAQIVAYWELRGRKAKTARILYLDSLKGAWAVMTAPVDFSDPFILEYAEKMSKHRSWLMALKSPPLMVPGDHCKSGFCSYRNSRLCYSTLIPPGEGSTVYENKEKAKKSEFAGPKTAEVKLW